MPNEDLNAEIEQLRKQLQALQSERESASEPSQPKEDERQKEKQEPVTEVEDILADMDLDKLDLAGQVKKLLDSLDQDIKDTKPSTLLIVFALGVLIGRLR